MGSHKAKSFPLCPSIMVLPQVCGQGRQIHIQNINPSEETLLSPPD